VPFVNFKHVQQQNNTAESGVLYVISLVLRVEQSIANCKDYFAGERNAIVKAKALWEIGG
jgi:hypothetical protein